MTQSVLSANRSLCSAFLLHNPIFRDLIIILFIPDLASRILTVAQQFTLRIKETHSSSPNIEIKKLWSELSLVHISRNFLQMSENKNKLTFTFPLTDTIATDNLRELRS